MRSEALRCSLHRLDPLGLRRDIGLHQRVLLQEVQHIVQMFATVLGLQATLRQDRAQCHSWLNSYIWLNLEA